MEFHEKKVNFIRFCLIVIFFAIVTSCNAKTKSVLKPYPTAVGDIVFSDGSAVSWSKNLNLTDDQKNNAVAVIFYAGKKGDLLDERLIGVGLHLTSEALKWAPKDTTGFLTSFDETKCDFSVTGPLTENEYSVKGLFKYDVYYDYKSGLNNACAVYDFTVDD